MASQLLDPAEIKAPAWMTGAQKTLFRRLVRTEIQSNQYISREKVDVFADYVCASSRLDDLRARLAAEQADNSTFTVDKARIIALNSQISSLVTLRAKLGEKL